MWVVAKYNSKEKFFLINNVVKSLSNEVKVFCPKFKYQKFYKNKIISKEKELLNDYIFFYHSSFSNKNFLKQFTNVRGLKYFLSGSFFCQNELINFINYCKSHQDKFGYIKKSFLDISHNNNYKFTSGPFINMMFKLIENNKNNFKVLVGNVITVLNKNSNYQYQLN